MQADVKQVVVEAVENYLRGLNIPGRIQSLELQLLDSNSDTVTTAKGFFRPITFEKVQSKLLSYKNCQSNGISLDAHSDCPTLLKTLQ